MSNRVITDSSVSPKPEQIDTSKHFWSAFGHSETEISARHIVRLMKERGTGWAPFTFDEIDNQYKKFVDDGVAFTFNKLISQEWIVQEGDQYRVTYDFIYRCHVSSPQD